MAVAIEEIQDVRPERLLYSVTEVASVLACSESYVWRLINRGEIPTVKLGRRRFIRRSALEQWLIAHEETR